MQEQLPLKRLDWNCVVVTHSLFDKTNDSCLDCWSTLERLCVPTLAALYHEVKPEVSFSDNNVKLHKAHIRTISFCSEHYRIRIKLRF
ncbi:hypothetical protein CFBP4215_04987 [Pseudomonas syringae pv. syringae]|nr:hypothetical protein CFBP4215_04987 [Pseudomonas syringae pv. syringae]